MAIARGAGTEIIRCVNLEDVDDSHDILIYGVQHHIYTVLSILCFCNAVDTAGNYIQCYLLGYDALGGSTDTAHYIFQQDMLEHQTFVWNDKFSFNGGEPSNFTGPMDNATKQDAIADQGNGTAQILKMHAEHASDNFDVICSFIDQNNS